MLIVDTLIVLCIIAFFYIVLSPLKTEPETSPTPETGSPDDMVVSNWIRWKRQPNRLLETIELMFKNLKEMRSVDDWIEIIREARHPNSLWEINYVKPTPQLIQVNNYIRKSEQIMLDPSDPMKLRSPYHASMDRLCLLHIIRAYLRAEEGKIDESLTIWRELYRSYLSVVSLERRSNLLMHLVVVFACNADFKASLACAKKHWALLRSNPERTRHLCGIWDNMVCIRLVQYYFIAYVPRFAAAFAHSLGLRDSAVKLHKKASLAPLMQGEMIVKMCSKSYYDHARSIMPELPDYDESTFTLAKRSRAQVLDKLDNKSEHKESTEVYQENLVKAIESEDYISTFDLASVKWDLWHAEAERERNQDRPKIESSRLLIEFLQQNKKVDVTSILDIGCGLTESVAEILKPVTIVSVDISGYVEDVRKKRGEATIRCPAETFFVDHHQDFDLCFSSLTLNCISSVDEFLKQCAAHCKYLCASILCGPQVYTSSTGPMSMSAVVVDQDSWINMIEKYFDIIKSEEEGQAYNVLNILGKSRTG